MEEDDYRAANVYRPWRSTRELPSSEYIRSGVTNTPNYCIDHSAGSSQSSANLQCNCSCSFRFAKVCLL